MDNELRRADESVVRAVAREFQTRPWAVLLKLVLVAVSPFVVVALIVAYLLADGWLQQNLGF